MIIDFHTHIFPDRLAPRAVGALAQSGGIRPYLDGTLSALSSSAVRASVNLSVVLPVVTRPEQHASILRFAREVNEGTEGSGLISFGGIHAAAEEAEKKLDEMVRLGFLGIKLHPVFQGVPVDDERTLRLLRAAYDRDLTVVLHAGWDISFPGNDCASADRIAAMLEKLPPRKLVLAHMGGWGMWKEAERYLGMEGLYLDTAFSMKAGEDGFLSPEGFARMVRLHGADRVLFGTDSPWSDQREAVEGLLASPLTGEEKEKILYSNGAALLKIRAGKA